MVGFVVTAYNQKGRQAWLVDRVGGGFFWSTASKYAAVFECENEAREAGMSMGPENYYTIARKLLAA